MYNQSSDMNINIYGPFNSTKEFIKQHLEGAAEKKQIDLEITDINDPAEYVSLGITSVPAIQINDEIMAIGSSRPIEFVEQIMDKIIEKSESKEYQTIIVPVDFSDYSKSAIAYAMSTLGAQAKCIRLVYINRPELKPEAPAIIVYQIESIKEELLSDMVNIAEAWKQELKLTIDIQHDIIDGLPGEVILNLSEMNDTDMIIMGTKGKGRLVKSLVGSVSTKVARNADCPVILVPAGSNNFSMSHLLYCSEEIETDIGAIKEVMKLSRANDTKLTVLHIENGEYYNENIIKHALQKIIPQNKLKIVSLTGSSSTSAINEYSDAANVDLIITSTKPRTKLGNLFHRSFSFEMAVKTEKPLLIINTQ